MGGKAGHTMTPATSLLTDLEARPDWPEFCEATTATWQSWIRSYHEPEEREMSEQRRRIEHLGDLIRAAVKLGFVVASRESDAREGRDPDFTEQDIADLMNQTIDLVETLS